MLFVRAGWVRCEGIRGRLHRRVGGHREEVADVAQIDHERTLPRIMK